MLVCGNANIDVVMDFEVFQRILERHDVTSPLTLQLEHRSLGTVQWTIKRMEDLKPGSRLQVQESCPGTPTTIDPEYIKEIEITVGGGGPNSARAARLLHPKETIRLWIPLGRGPRSKFVKRFLERHSIEIFPVPLRGDLTVNLVIEGFYQDRVDRVDRVIIKGPPPKVLPPNIGPRDDDVVLIQSIYSTQMAITAFQILLQSRGGFVATKSLCRNLPHRTTVFSQLDQRHFLQADEEEFAYLTGEEPKSLDDPKLLQDASTLGVECVLLVTFGSRGGIAISPEEVIRWFPAPGRPLKKVAAGDVFAAEFTHTWRAKGTPLEEAVRSAAAAADLFVLGGWDALKPANLERAKSKVVLIKKKEVITKR